MPMTHLAVQLLSNVEIQSAIGNLTDLYLKPFTFPISDNTNQPKVETSRKLFVTISSRNCSTVSVTRDWGDEFSVLLGRLLLYFTTDSI